MTTVTIINTGIANTASVAAAFRRLGADVELTDDADRVRAATHLVLPGVGAFAPGIRALRDRGLDRLITDRIAHDRPTLCICLGLQLLCASSDESPGVAGLAVIDRHVGAFPSTARTPQFGWNLVVAGGDCRKLATGHAYFANSYRVTGVPEGWRAATADHAGPFLAAIERGGTLACQFHPELSGRWGLDLLARWMTGAPGVGDTAGPRAPGGVARRVIPCLDIRDGRVVKGVRFANLRDAGDPVGQASAYESQAADEIVILDVSATSEGRSAALETVASVRACLSVPLTVGGGVRALPDALALLDAGADKVGINSAAVERPAIVRELADRVGTQCVVLAIDAARRRTPGEGRWEVVTRSGTNRTGLDAVRWAAEGARLGAGEILLTAFDRDGTHEGYDLGLIRAIAQVVSIPIVASGGASSAAHMADAIRAGADAVLAASIFHDARTTVSGIKAELAGLGVPVRPAPTQTELAT